MKTLQKKTPVLFLQKCAKIVVISLLESTTKVRSFIYKIIC